MRLVCTDLDRTLLPNGEQPESDHARPILWQLLRTHHVNLAYVSGRDLGRVLEAIDDYSLPIPNAIVADVGTSVYTLDAGRWTQHADWHSMISQDWNGSKACDIQRLLSDITLLVEQEPDRQATYKQSYYYGEAIDQTQLLDVVGRRLDANGINASLVCSHDPEKKVGLLDVLPRSATKREAVAFLQTLCDVAVEDVLFAGDSGNDVNAICAANPSVLVANADTSTRQAVNRACEQDASLSASIYMAEGELAVAGSLSLNGFYAAGIVEGLLHFRPAWRDHLEDVQWVRDALHANDGQGLRD